MGLPDASSIREHLSHTPHLPENTSPIHLIYQGTSPTYTHISQVWTQLLGQHESLHGLAGNFFDFIDHVVLHCF